MGTAFAGMFYGILINTLDDGKAHHAHNGGFWGRESKDMLNEDSPSLSLPALQKPILVRKGIVKDGMGYGKVCVCVCVIVCMHV